MAAAAAFTAAIPVITNTVLPIVTEKVTRALSNSDTFEKIRESLKKVNPVVKRIQHYAMENDLPNKFNQALINGYKSKTDQRREYNNNRNTYPRDEFNHEPNNIRIHNDSRHNRFRDHSHDDKKLDIPVDVRRDMRKSRGYNEVDLRGGCNPELFDYLTGRSNKGYSIAQNNRCLKHSVKYIESLFKDFCLQIKKSRLFKDTFARHDRDGIHSDLLKTLKLEDFLHFLCFLYRMLSKIYFKENKKYIVSDHCDFCVDGNTSVVEENWMEFLSAEKSQFSLLLNTYFEIDLPTIQTILSHVKTPCYSKNGTYGVDENKLCLDIVKSCYCPNTRYMGILYTTKYTSDYSVYLHHARNIIDMYLNDKILKFAYVFSVGKTPINPEHWCGLIIDMYNNKFYFYNSLATASQYDPYFLKTINDELAAQNMFDLAIDSHSDRPFRKIKKLNLITNTAAQQVDNPLCGLYVGRFMLEMLKHGGIVDIENVFRSKFDSASFLTDASMETQQRYVAKILNNKFSYFENFLKCI